MEVSIRENVKLISVEIRSLQWRIHESRYVGKESSIDGKQDSQFAKRLDGAQ